MDKIWNLLLASILTGLLSSCATTESSEIKKDDPAYKKGTVTTPSYDIPYKIMWRATITAVQDLGYFPVDSYRAKFLLKTDLHTDSENILDKKKVVSRVYVYFRELSLAEKKNNPNARYALRICVPVFEGNLNGDDYKYTKSNIPMQKKIKEKLDSVLDEMHRKGFNQ